MLRAGRMRWPGRRYLFGFFTHLFINLMQAEQILPGVVPDAPTVRAGIHSLFSNALPSGQAVEARL